MYPQPDKSPNNSVDTNRKRKVPVEERGAPEDVKQVRLMPSDDQKSTCICRTLTMVERREAQTVVIFSGKTTA